MLQARFSRAFRGIFDSRFQGVLSQQLPIQRNELEAADNQDWQSDAERPKVTFVDTRTASYPSKNVSLDLAHGPMFRFPTTLGQYPSTPLVDWTTRHRRFYSKPSDQNATGPVWYNAVTYIGVPLHTNKV
jgi:hypothetical protein